jgi:Ca2+-binding RTX toxin-like protein
VFTAIGANGALLSAAFFVGAAAHDSSDRIVYDKPTGQLYYDADGTGAAAKILFATVTAGTTIALGDLWVG